MENLKMSIIDIENELKELSDEMPNPQKNT